MSEATSAQNWRRHLLWQLPLLAIFCYLAYLSSHGLSEELDKFMPETMTNCSTHNGQGSGYRALFDLCRKVGLQSEQFESSYRELETSKAALVMVAPTVPLAPFDVDRLLAWVAEGHDLIYLDYCMYGSGSELLNKLGLRAYVSKTLDDAVIAAPPGIAEMQHVSQFVLSSETRLRGDGTTILKDEHNNALMIEVKHGNGRCLIATLPSLCSNRRISEKSNWGNFQFMVNWLKSSGGKVLFDERAHGYTTSRNVFTYVARGPAGYIGLQLCLILALCIFSLNQRFGPSKQIPIKRKIASSEFIDGMARTYEKGRAYDAAFSILFGSFRTRLCKALALSPEAKPDEIARAWSQATSLKYEETHQFLLSAEELHNQRGANEEQLTATIKECDRLYNASRAELAMQHGRRLGG